MTSPVRTICIEKERLLQALVQATLEFNRIYSARIASMASGEDGPSDEQLIETEIRRDNTKYALLAHEEEHGC